MWVAEYLLEFLDLKLTELQEIIESVNQRNMGVTQRNQREF